MRCSGIVDITGVGADVESFLPNNFMSVPLFIFFIIGNLDMDKVVKIIEKIYLNLWDNR